MAKVHVIHDNSIWVEPLRTAFNELGTPFEEWFLDRGVLDLRAAPPRGVAYNPRCEPALKRSSTTPTGGAARRSSTPRSRNHSSKGVPSSLKAARSGSTQMPFSWMTWTFAMALILTETRI